jgi:hypothetical protein
LVVLTLEATREQVIAAMRGPEPVAVPVETVRMETPGKVEQVPVQKPEPVLEKAVEKVVEKPVEKIPEKPQVIRIVGLDEGPREIVVPAVRPEKQNP